MQFLRGAFILLLLVGLPTAAIMGDADELHQLLGFDTASQPSIASDNPNEPAEIPSPPAGEPPFHAPIADSPTPPAVFPKMRPGSPSEPTGRPLRSALFRPSATDEISYHRQLAVENTQDAVNTSTLEELAQQLQAMGAKSYRMLDEQGDYLFMCEFAPQSPEQFPTRFEARSSTKATAMRDVLAQVQKWQGKLR